MLAVVAIILRGTGSAARAGVSIPVLQPNVRAAVSVSVENSRDQHEEVIQPALCQGRPDRLPAGAFAKGFTVDVRMSDLLVTTGGVGVQSNHPVGLRRVPVLPVESDLERSQPNLFQHDRVRGHRNRVRLEVNFHLLKLAFQCQKVTKDF